MEILKSIPYEWRFFVGKSSTNGGLSWIVHSHVGLSEGSQEGSKSIVVDG